MIAAGSNLCFLLGLLWLMIMIAGYHIGLARGSGGRAAAHILDRAALAADSVAQELARHQCKDTRSVLLVFDRVVATYLTLLLIPSPY